MNSRRELNKRSRMKEEEAKIDEQLRAAGLLEYGQSLDEKRQLLSFITDTELPAKDEEESENDDMHNEQTRIERTFNSSASNDHELKHDDSVLKKSAEISKAGTTRQKYDNAVAGPSRATSSNYIPDSEIPSPDCEKFLTEFPPYPPVEFHVKEDRSSSVECYYSPSRASPDRSFSEYELSDSDSSDKVLNSPKEPANNNKISDSIQIESPIVRLGSRKGTPVKTENKIVLGRSSIDDANVSDIKCENKENDESLSMPTTLGCEYNKNLLRDSHRVTPNKENPDQTGSLELIESSSEELNNSDSMLPSSPVKKCALQKIQIKNERKSELQEEKNFEILGSIEKNMFNSKPLKCKQFFSERPRLVYFKNCTETDVQCVQRILNLLEQENTKILELQNKLPLNQKFSVISVIKPKRRMLNSNASNNELHINEDSFNTRVTRSQRGKACSPEHLIDSSDDLEVFSAPYKFTKKLKKTNINEILEIDNELPNVSMNSSRNESLRLHYSGDSDTDINSSLNINNSLKNNQSSEKVVNYKLSNFNVESESQTDNKDNDNDSDDISVLKTYRKTFALPSASAASNDYNTPTTSKEHFPESDDNQEEKKRKRDSISIKDNEADRDAAYKRQKGSSSDDNIFTDICSEFINNRENDRPSRNSKTIKPAPLRFVNSINSGKSSGTTSTVNRPKKHNNMENMNCILNDDLVEEVSASGGTDLVACPLCDKKFPIDKVQIHASDCNGIVEEEEEEEVTMSRGRRAASVETVSDEKENAFDALRSSTPQTSAGSSRTQTEQCFYCDKHFPLGDEYLIHTRSCDERKSLFDDGTPVALKNIKKTYARGPKSPRSLFEHIDGQENGVSSDVEEVVVPSTPNDNNSHIQSVKPKHSLFTAAGQDLFNSSPDISNSNKPEVNPRAIVMQQLKSISKKK